MSIPRGLVSDVLKAIDEGRVSSEESLRAALDGPQAVTALLTSAARRGCGRPTVWRTRKVPDAVMDAAVASVKKRLGRSRNVTSVHWGVLRRRGRRTSETAVVVHVKRKLPLPVLRKYRQTMAPSTVTIRHKGKRFRIDVDVQAVKTLASLQDTTFVQPGGNGTIRTGGDPIGALGAIVPGTKANERFAITAGHVAALIPKGGTADCEDDSRTVFQLGKFRGSAFHKGTDIAAIGPIPAPVPQGAALSSRIARNPGKADTNKRVELLVPGIPTPILSTIDDVNVTRGFDTTPPITMSGLTAITRVTERGDSGSPALLNGVLIGFVIGSDAHHTYLLPARRALDAIDPAL